MRLPELFADRRLGLGVENDARSLDDSPQATRFRALQGAAMIPTAIHKAAALGFFRSSVFFIFAVAAFAETVFVFFLLAMPLRRRYLALVLILALGVVGCVYKDLQYRRPQLPPHLLPHPLPPRSSRTMSSSNTAPMVALTIALITPVPRWMPS
jgi:hypothetical protein